MTEPMKPDRSSLACFVTPHGFGHAARASAVLQALWKRQPDLHVDLFTTVPTWFFRDLPPDRWRYHRFCCDLGLVQPSPLHEDLKATQRRLDRFFPFRTRLLQHLAQRLEKLGCQMVLCDIAPLGIAAAKSAGIPSVLVENFTWDWIYRAPAYMHACAQHSDYIEDIFSRADLHIQTQPARARFSPDLVTAPVARPRRQKRGAIRRLLQIPEEIPLVLISMGGVVMRNFPLEKLAANTTAHFVVLGASQQLTRQGHMLLVPHQSGMYHPDLVAAADLVVAKAGYSTIAEVHQARVPMAFISRPDFPESAVLGPFVREQMGGCEISEKDFMTGRWLRQLPELLHLKAPSTSSPNGADQIADFIRSRQDRLFAH